MEAVDTEGEAVVADDVGPPAVKKTARKNYCMYCKRMLSNLSRHMRIRHADEEAVQEYMALADASPMRRKRLRTAITNRIRHRGNRIYNEDVVENRSGRPLIPAKQPRRKGVVDNTTHVMCKHCSGFYKRETLFKHLTNCTVRRVPDEDAEETPKRKTRRVLVDHADQLVRIHDDADEILRDEVFPKMQKDALTVIAQSDGLICRFGNEFRRTHRRSKQVSYCSGRLRLLARIFSAMRDARPDVIHEFSDCISPRHFDLLMRTVRRLCKYDVTSGVTSTPSVSPRLCSSLKRCANILKSDAIKSESSDREATIDVVYQMNNFLHLMEKDWGPQVGAMSEVSRRRRKVMRKDPIPDADDIRTFGQYIESLCPRYTKDLEAVTTLKNYERLAKLVIAHIITLNRRRPNETVEITIEEYRSTLERMTDYGADEQNVLTAEEMESSRDLVIFYVAANKNLKKVPVLLTKRFHRALDVLLASQEKVGVSSRYIFGRPGNTELYDGSAVLREMVAKAGLKDPSAFTANALRHHAATSSQLQSHDDTYTKRLSKFMGHDLQTHEHFYEMPLPLVQKSKVGHRLLQMIRPKQKTTTATVTSATVAATEVSPPTGSAVRQHDGVCTRPCVVRIERLRPSMDTMEIRTPRRLEEEEDEEMDVVDDDLQRRIDICASATRTVVHPPGDDPTPSTSANPPRTPVSVTRALRSSTFRQDRWSHDGSWTAPPGVTSEEDTSTSAFSETPPKKVLRKRRWTAGEKRAVYEAFGQQFLMDLKPARSEIKALWLKEADLFGDRTLDQVVTYVNNIVTNKQRIPTPTRSKIKNMVAGGRMHLSP